MAFMGASCGAKGVLGLKFEAKPQTQHLPSPFVSKTLKKDACDRLKLFALRP
jgi:hypothetical protein